VINEQKSPARRDNTRRGSYHHGVNEMAIQTIIPPAELNGLWNKDRHAAAWYLFDLSAAQRDDLAYAYWRWINRPDVSLARVVDSFEALLWLTEPHNPDYQPRPAFRYAPDWETIEDAYRYAARHDMPPRWRNALDKARENLLTGAGAMVECAADGSLILAYIPSATSGDVYTVNGACECQAYQNEQPCWHRAAKRLLAICWELDRPARRVAA
jgi:hypothetical protein